jgi:general secretion pathway protein L
VLLSPLSAALLSQDGAPSNLLAEPAVAALAEQCFKRPVNLQQAPQRWLLATQSGWDLAQFDLASSDGRRTLKRLGQAWQSLRHAPQWRALRWGVASLLLAQLLGLNLWAWHEKSALQAQRVAINTVLTQTFPTVRVVEDAPLQMERELARLRQSTGASSGSDLETMLAVLAGFLPVNRSVAAVEFSDGVARLKGLQLTEGEVAVLSKALKYQGYNARNEGETLVLQTEGRP